MIYVSQEIYFDTRDVLKIGIKETTKKCLLYNNHALRYEYTDIYKGAISYDIECKLQYPAISKRFVYTYISNNDIEWLINIKKIDIIFRYL